MESCLTFNKIKLDSAQASKLKACTHHTCVQRTNQQYTLYI